MKRKILITGATGLVGSHVLLDVLSDPGNEVFALKRPSSDLTALKNLFQWKSKESLLDEIRWINYDLNSDYSEALTDDQIDEIIHTAAVVSFNPADYAAMQHINVAGTKRLLDLARTLGVQKFGFISSIAALGRVNSSGKYSEGAEWTDNDDNSFYSKTKYQAERLVIEANSKEFSTYVVNPGVILGPCDWNKSSGTFFRTGAKGIAFYTRGKNGFVDVRDVAKGILKVMKEGNSGERHILVSESISYRKVFSELCNAFGQKPPGIYSPKWLTNLGWRLDKIKSSLKGVPPTLTKETARNANNCYEYDQSKMISKGFEFTPISETIRYSAPFFKQYYC